MIEICTIKAKTNIHIDRLISYVDRNEFAIHLGIVIILISYPIWKRGETHEKTIADSESFRST